MKKTGLMDVDDVDDADDVADALALLDHLRALRDCHGLSRAYATGFERGGWIFKPAALYTPPKLYTLYTGMRVIRDDIDCARHLLGQLRGVSRRSYGYAGEQFPEPRFCIDWSDDYWRGRPPGLWL